MKIRPMEAVLFNADRRTDRYEEATSRFSQFCRVRLKAMYIRRTDKTLQCAISNVFVKSFHLR
jgi:hypothetical protein